MARRIRLSVIFSKERGQWQFKHGARVVEGFAKKSDAIEAGRQCGRDWYEQGGLAQLQVHKRNGQIEFENTYGKDPRRYKG